MAHLTEAKHEQLKLEILDLYYGESGVSLKDLADRFEVELSLCQEELQNVLFVSRVFKEVPEDRVSQVTLNRILAHAREAAEKQANRVSFWQWLLKPSLSFASAGLAMVLVLSVWNTRGLWLTTEVEESSVAQQIQGNQESVASHNLVVKRLLETPLFDQQGEFQHYSVPKSKNQPYYNSMVSNVSVGEDSDSGYSMMDEVDQKIISRTLDEQDLQTLYYRAIRLEKQGYIKDALKDYEFISQNYPQFEYKQALPLAMARCFEKLGDKKSSLSLIDAYEKSYGTSSDLQLWKDQLKSETF